jgi:hypothetical protein
MERLVGEPLRLDLNLLRNQKSIVYVNPNIPTSALNLRVAEQKLDGPEIAGPSVDHRSFGTPE